MNIPVLLTFASIAWSLQPVFYKRYLYQHCLDGSLGVKWSELTSLSDLPEGGMKTVEKCMRHCFMMEMGVVQENRVEPDWDITLFGKEVASDSCRYIRARGLCELGYKAYKCYSALLKL